MLGYNEVETIKSKIMNFLNKQDIDAENSYFVIKSLSNDLFDAVFEEDEEDADDDDFEEDEGADDNSEDNEDDAEDLDLDLEENEKNKKTEDIKKPKMKNLPFEKKNKPLIKRPKVVQKDIDDGDF